MAEGRSRFDPPFRNDMHSPRAEDAEIVRAINNSRFSEGGRLRVFGLVHGHFLGDGKDSVVVAALRRVDSGFSPITLLFFNRDGGWQFREPEDFETVAYCRVVPVSVNKDVLLCQSDLVGPAGNYGRGQVDTNLYTVDFTRNPSASYFLHLEDTVATGQQCVAWASVKSLDIRALTVQVVVEYGRKQLPREQKALNEFRLRARKSNGSPFGFPVRLFNLDFKIEDGNVVPMESSMADYKYVTARWAERQPGTCSASSGTKYR